jgi:multicomponent K+:H+ antiporter subunit G
MTGASAAVEAVVAALLVLSGLLVLVSALGVLRLPGFFLRMHPAALAFTLANWCVAIAGTVFFSALEGRLLAYPLLIPVVLAFTVPVTTLLLARVELFRRRLAGARDTPPSITPPDVLPPDAVGGDG